MENGLGVVVQTSPRRFVLRSATREAHEQLDLTVGELRSLERYKRFLKATYLFRTQIKASFLECGWPGAMSTWRPTMLSREILADLNDLAVPPPTLPVCSHRFSDEQLYGVAYVLLGSGLGAQVLVKRAKVLGFTAEFGSRFLHAQISSGSDWDSFLDILERHPELEMARLVKASRLTFDFAHTAFLQV